jgi:hypothetical protein
LDWKDHIVVINGEEHYIKSYSGRYRWQDCIIPEIIKPLIDKKRAKGSKYTIRGLCYALEDLKVIPKLEKDFDKVYDAMNTARENGDLPINAFIDNTRYIFKDFEDEYKSVNGQIYDTIDSIGNQNFIEEAKKNIPKWAKQPIYVEMWVEKFSFSEVPRQILKDLHVTIVPNRGWSSKTFLHDNLSRIYRKIKSDKELQRVAILYLGDLDPSGWAMDRHYRKNLNRVPGAYIEFRRVAITKEQLNTFDLRSKTNPNPEVMRKLQNNPNKVRFESEFGSLFQIELEALEHVPEFEELLRGEIINLYDDNVNRQVLELPENNPTEEQKNKIIGDWARKNIFHFKSGSPF